MGLCQLLFECKDNRRSFWSFVRGRKQSPPPPSFYHNNCKITSPDIISSAFSDYFCSVCKQSGPVPNLPPPCSLHIPELSHISVSANQIAALLKQLPSNKSPGPDCILPNVLNKISSEIAHPLGLLFNASLSIGQLPDAWRCANITPVHKKGDKVLLTNYRPVALTSVLCKVLERIITVVLNNHLNTFALLNPYQHGFVKHRSCVTQLVNIIQSWSSTLDRRRPPRVDAVFLDMSKAFDTMPHHILLEKLATSFNVRGKLWCWVRSFLTDRKQRVLFRGGVSSWVNITSGVPQGSVLGPLLFNLFVNDISHSTSSSCVLFADDILLYRTIENANDELVLQSDLDKLANWSNVNEMTFNISKTKVMHITRCRNLDPILYNLGTLPIESTKSFQYLGLTLDSKLSWATHTSSVVARANRMLGFIRTVARGSSTNAIFSLYKSLVLPILEYGLPAWHPFTLSQQNQLERVQRTATRLALKQRRGVMSYEDRLQHLHWHPLTNRRNYLLSAFVFKVLHGTAHCESILTGVFINPRHLDSLTFRHLSARTDSLFHSPSHRFPRLWDTIPRHSRSCCNLSSYDISPPP